LKISANDLYETLKRTGLVSPHTLGDLELSKKIGSLSEDLKRRISDDLSFSLAQNGYSEDYNIKAEWLWVHEIILGLDSSDDE